MTTTEKIILTAVVTIIAINIYDIVADWRKCHEAGGVYVSSVIGYECLKAEKL